MGVLADEHRVAANFGEGLFARRHQQRFNPDGIVYRCDGRIGSGVLLGREYENACDWIDRFAGKLNINT